jgi:hypothetical protein
LTNFIVTVSAKATEANITSNEKTKIALRKAPPHRHYRRNYLWFSGENSKTNQTD